MERMGISKCGRPLAALYPLPSHPLGHVGSTHLYLGNPHPFRSVPWIPVLRVVFPRPLYHPSMPQLMGHMPYPRLWGFSPQNNVHDTK